MLGFLYGLAKFVSVAAMGAVFLLSLLFIDNLYLSVLLDILMVVNGILLYAEDHWKMHT